MWWIFSFYDFALPFLAFRQLLSTIRPEVTALRFFMLGLIPGTNIQITFNDIVLCFGAIAFGLIVARLYKKGQKITKNIDPHPYLPVKMNYFDSIAL